MRDLFILGEEFAYAAIFSSSWLYNHFMRNLHCLLLLMILLAGCNLSAAETPVPTLTATQPKPASTSTRSPSPLLTSTLTRLPTITLSPLPTATTAVKEGVLCTGGEKLIALLIDPRLMPGIEPSLAQFAADLCAAGYSVRQRASDFANPPALRFYLAQLFGESQKKLSGAILIGDAPRAYQWVVGLSANPQFPSTREETLSTQYYADLNGVFSASPGYQSPGKRAYSYDQHSGDLNWEIWVSWLPLYKGDVGKTVEALQRYFAKNHAYRLGQTDVPRAFMEISEHFTATSPAQDAQVLANLSFGQYAWIPWSSSPAARFYWDTKTAASSLAQGYAELSRGAADFAVLDAHGSYLASGQLTIQKVESQPLRTVFLWSNGCAVGNLDFPDNFLTAALYSPTSLVLAAKGTTNNSGGMGNNQNGFFGANIARAMSQQRSFGEAVQAHVNVPLIYPWSDSREFHFGTAILLGDGTLYFKSRDK